MSRPKKWTQEAVNRLRRLHGEKRPIAEMSVELGASENAIEFRLMQLGLSKSGLTARSRSLCKTKSPMENIRIFAMSGRWR